ncbi:MAG: metallophosphoesterase [Chthoniobacteraceae bacterium]|nr:metallophosphoesterase [Chthoniobacteraceae bacterium]
MNTDIVSPRLPVFKLWLVVFAALFCTINSPADTSFIAPGSVWKYLDNGSDQGTAWRASAFDDSSWAFGPSELGYGGSDEATPISFGSDPENKHITTYFRTSFTVADPKAYTSLLLRLSIQPGDGAVVYLNGVEVRRDNLPPGPINSTALAVTSAPQEPPPAGNGPPPSNEPGFYQSILLPDTIVAGTNVFAVEVHKSSVTSPSMEFDMEFVGMEPRLITRGPYLQAGTPESIVVRWRTDEATDSRVRFGIDAANLDAVQDDSTLTTEHEVKLTGLTADTHYYYSIGTSAATLATGSEYSFFTPPPVGVGHPTRIWVLGDSGMPNIASKIVRDGYTSFTGNRYTDVWLMLGDNAYPYGTDADYQAAVFDTYPGYLRQTVLWSTIGNHDTAFSSAPDVTTTPFFKIFTQPTNAEAGGVPSGTEKYYAFDHGRIHFICLDSMSSSRLPGSPMLTWLQADLESTTQDWIIAFFHHPPYTKGSHNSDLESDLIEVRANVLPILEAAGVDLILAGHSHCYERSFLIDGHYGPSTSFTDAMKVDGGDGREDGSGVYDKPTNLAANQGAVYVVAGNGGHVTFWSNGTAETLNPVPHPAMYLSLLHVGSLAIDIDGNRLEAKMIGATGTVEDHFTITKSVPNIAPSVRILSPNPNASILFPATVPITAEAADSDGKVVQVDFYAGSKLIGTATSAPFAVTWKAMAPGNYALTASATDNRGATTTSAPVNVLIKPLRRPQPPTGLSATAGDGNVMLNWEPATGASSYTIRRAGINCRPFTKVASEISTTSFTDSTVKNGSVYYYMVTAVNAIGESGASKLVRVIPQVPPSTPAAPTNLAAVAVSNSQTRLLWTDNAQNELGYRIERSKENGPFAPIAIAGRNTTTFLSAGLKPGKSYSYRVRAFNNQGASSYSNVATVANPK